jgi:ribosomal protein S12 methylthiotransferase
MTQDASEAEIIIINTCSFIEPATNESIDTILELAKQKLQGSCRRLIVTGCLPERFREEIIPALPEVDIFLGTGAFDRIVSVAENAPGINACLLPDPNLYTLDTCHTPRVRTSAHSAYLKITEGCDRHCTYCVIPKLRGRQRSRPIENIVAEARSLIRTGIKEMNLIGQDSTSYGKDLELPTDFSALIKRLSALSDGVWTRFLYGHPSSLKDHMIETIASHSNVCSYFDIPIQHVSASILKRMARDYTEEDLYRLFAKIRSRDPDAVLRTTVILGFPGETDKDFEALMNFVQQIRFENLGAFIYSDAEDLPSHKLPDHVPQKAARERYDQLMTMQAEISLEKNQRHIGRNHNILIENKQGDKLFSGRASFQAPEVDGMVYIHSPNLESGSFTTVKITDAMEYDLVGEVV